jgi:enamine deaminase RidA (YjgF/YER057c/UK114 family)
MDADHRTLSDLRKTSSDQEEPMPVAFLNPEGLHTNPAYSQTVSVSGPAKTVYIGGQNAVDAAGNVGGQGDLGAQVAQILYNLELALAGAGARPQHVVKWTIYVVQGQDVRVGLSSFQSVWGNPANPPIITVLFVAGLANPDFLAELEAIAIIPEEA